jgi:hypothetical protein
MTSVFPYISEPKVLVILLSDNKPDGGLIVSSLSSSLAFFFDALC